MDSRVLLPLPVAFAAILLILALGLSPVIDPDFFWHVTTGQLIHLTGEIPSSDVFSHTAAGQPWVVQGWLADVILYNIWNASGVMGMRALVALMLVLTWFAVYSAARLYAARTETALILSVATIALMVPALAPRPTLFTALGLAVTLHSLLAFRRTAQLRWLLMLPPVFALWSNLHFGFVTGLGLIGLFVLSELLARAMPLVHEHTERGYLLAPGPLLVGLLCAAAIGLNPHGYGVLVTTFQMTIVNAGTPISEWQSPSFGNLTGKMVFAAISLFLTTRALARRALHWVDIVVPIAVIGAALAAQRHVALMGIVVMPFVARALSDWEAKVFDLRRWRSTKGVAAAANRDLDPRVSSLLNFALVASVGAATALAVPYADRHFATVRESLLPVHAADFVLENNLQGRIFNTYNGGGYLIYRLYPRQLVFIDGRYNPYPMRVISDYFAIVGGEPDWFATLERYRVDIVISETRANFRQLMLLRSEFKLVYEDRNFSVLVRDNERFRELPTVEPSLERETTG